MNISFVKNVPFRFPVILAILLITATIIPILYLGIPYFPDQVHHFHIASDYAYSISHGDFFPNWAAQENFGYGGLGIRLYPPIPYYVLAFIHLATGEWYWASVLTYSFWLLLGCLGIFLWAREYYSPKMSLFAAVIFAFMPYRLFELYEVTMYGEFAGCAVLPFLFYFTHQICQKGNFKYTIGLAVTYAVLIFTHLPTTVIASFSLFIFFIGFNNFITG